MSYHKLLTMMAQDSTADLDLIWKTALLFASPRPSWSGMMQFVHHGTHPGKSSFVFLPMIDMKSTDPTCIYSTLKFICEHAHHHNATPIITFDQPLWWKAMLIIEAEPEGSNLHSIVLRLGCLILPDQRRQRISFLPFAQNKGKTSRHISIHCNHRAAVLLEDFKDSVLLLSFSFILSNTSALQATSADTNPSINCA